MEMVDEHCSEVRLALYEWSIEINRSPCIVQFVTKFAEVLHTFLRKKNILVGIQLQSIGLPEHSAGPQHCAEQS